MKCEEYLPDGSRCGKKADGVIGSRWICLGHFYRYLILGERDR